MGAQVATRSWAHCTLGDATTASELCGRWQAAGYMVAEHTTALGEVRMSVTALPPGATQTIAPSWWARPSSWALWSPSWPAVGDSRYGLSCSTCRCSRRLTG